MSSISPMVSGASFPLRQHSVNTARRPRPLSFYEQGEEIYAQGEPSGVLFKIEYGAVRLYRLLTDGRRQVVAFHIEGDVFGLEAWECRSFYAEAIAPSWVVKIERNDEGLAREVIASLALHGMIRAQEHLLVVGRQSAAEKIAVFLLDLHTRQGGSGIIDLPMSRTDIGDYLGLTVETVSRNISKLRDSGVIRLKNARCVIIEKMGLLRRLCE